MKKIIIGISVTVVIAFAIVLAIGFYVRKNNKENVVPRETVSKEQVLGTAMESYKTLFEEIKNIPTVKIGEPALVEGEGPSAPGGVCFPVEINEKHIGYFSELHLWKNQLLGYFCDIDKSVSAFPETDFFGYPDYNFTVINLTSGEVRKLEPIDWSFLSNPNACGSLLAYWGTQYNEKAESIEDTKVLIYLYDWESNKVVTFKELPPRVVATDWPGFFEQPEWSTDCKTATFTDNEEKHTLSVSNIETENK
jgi:hypothetical protein